jgi:hypothetical protein
MAKKFKELPIQVNGENDRYFIYYQRISKNLYRVQLSDVIDLTLYPFETIDKKALDKLKAGDISVLEYCADYFE